MKNQHHRPLFFGLLLAASLPMSSIMADVTLPAIISDHMVLQAEMAAPIWGQAEPDEAVTVEIAGQKKSTKAGPDGRWQVKLDPIKPGEATTLTVKGKNTIVVNDVLVGEVWLCSGQSNMAIASKKRKGESADALPSFRFFTETSPGKKVPEQIGAGQWQLCSSETIRENSRTAYFFGRNLHESLKRPVGVVVAAVSGSAIKAWSAGKLEEAAGNAEAGDNEPADKKARKMAPVQGSGDLFNGKIAPLIPYAIRGAVWYQGESNAMSPESGKGYATAFAMLITEWRAHWGQGDFPFVWVQLPQYQTDRFLGWRELRESQLKTLRLPNTGMAVTADINIPSPGKIHPEIKQEVARRLCAWALAKVYGQNIPFNGPLPTGQEVKGSEIVCSFDHAEGMKPSDGALKGFMIAGDDKQWVPATASIVGNKVVVSSPDVKRPVAVRYSWEFVPDGNLVNAADLPASPFRSDDW